jgi:hypothetical protein
MLLSREAVASTKIGRLGGRLGVERSSVQIRPPRLGEGPLLTRASPLTDPRPGRAPLRGDVPADEYHGRSGRGKGDVDGNERERPAERDFVRAAGGE